MKVLFVGIGSIGTRHLKNLHTVANERGLTLDVTALRSSSRELPAETARLLNRQISALDECVAAAIRSKSAQRTHFYIERKSYYVELSL